MWYSIDAVKGTPQNKKEMECKIMRKVSNFSQLAILSKHGEDGLAGDTFEIALKEFFEMELKVSSKGVVDLPVKVSQKAKRFNKVEVKTGAGEVRNELKGNSYVIYCPVVDLEQDLYHQEAFVIQRTIFIECLKAAKCYRYYKKATDGSYGDAIQTFWNRKQNAPHGKKIYALLDELYEHGTPLADWLEEIEG